VPCHFLVSVLERWNTYLDCEKRDQPPSPITAAFKMEADRNNWLIPIPWHHGPNGGTLIGILQQKEWLGQLLAWIAEQGPEKLSPCLVSAKAAGMQEAYDKAAAAAA
jgi:hypothetical protein